MLKTLTNSYHRTTVQIRVPDNFTDMTPQEIYGRICHLAQKEFEDGPGLWTRKYRRIQRTLCGMTDCSCGTVRE